MKLSAKLKNLSAGTGILLSVPLLLLLSPPTASCQVQETEKMYLVTETQLTQLEENLNKLKAQNNTLQMQLTQSKVQLADLQTQSTMLQMQVKSLKQSLTNANQLLTQYETSQQTEKCSEEEKDYAVGLGVGGNGLAIAGDVKNIWFVVDKDNGIIGYKVRF